MKNTKRDYHARLVIYDLPTMTDYQIDRLIKWLDSMKDIKKENKKDFNKIYTLRLTK